MKRVAILQAGTTDARVRARYGDYPDWFARVLMPHCEVRVFRAHDRERPEPGWDGYLVTGSPASVTENAPWMGELACWLLGAASAAPVLGVCFGHQLLAVALGGRVEKNPKGREAGVSEVLVTEAGAADPLFRGLPRRLAVQQTHEDHVAALPPGATLLATNAMTPVQAFAHGDRIRCVQFHPEMDAARSRLLAEVRREKLDRTAPGGSAAVLASIRETPDATLVLLNWVRAYVGAM